MTAEDFKKELATYGTPEKAQNNAWFFKTGKGQYGEGDKFVGATVPQTRLVCKKYRLLPLSEVKKLLHSPIHEHRLAAVLIMVDQYKRADTSGKEIIFKLYLEMLAKGRINNWDIIDSSAHKIVGLQLLGKPKDLLIKLARSDSLWDRRVAIISTFADIAEGDLAPSFMISLILLHDKEDLIQKAVGWTLREVGKRISRQDLLLFLDEHAHEMPRTMLRYSIEHLSANQRKMYLSK